MTVLQFDHKFNLIFCLDFFLLQNLAYRKLLVDNVKCPKQNLTAFFEDTEVWNPSKFCYTTWNDIVRAYLSRVKNENSYTSATAMYL